MSRPEADDPQAKLLRHNQALKRLSGSPLIRSGQLQAAFEMMTEILSQAMDVERASFWSYHPEQAKIICQDLYQQNSDQHSRGKELWRQDYPRYFEALERQQVIMATDAHHDPRTSEFSSAYLSTLGISAMLDIPIFLDQQLYGVICLEQVSPSPREWTSEEELFGMAVADFVALSLESKRRLEAEDALRQREKTLETLLKERNQTLAEQESFLQAMTKSIQDALIVVDHEDQIIFWNPGATRIFGYQEAEILKHSIFEILDLENPEPVLHLHELPTDTLLELNIRHQRGELVPVEFQLNRMQGSSGLQTIALLRDLTQRKAFEQQLRIFERLAQASGQGICMSTLDGLIQYCNPVLAQWLGFDQNEETLGLNLLNTYTAGSQTILKQDILPHLLSLGQWTEELVLESQSGQEIPVIANIFVIQDPQQESFTIAQILSNLSEQKRVQLELRQASLAAQAANHAKSEFLANMSHEIRTPMNAILGFSQLLARQLQSSQHREYIQAIQRSGRLLMNLINDILDLSKIEAGKLDIQLQPTKTRDILNEIQLLFISKAQEKGLEFKLDISPDLPEWLLLDELRLRQVLLNLVSNAVKFTDQGSISIKVRSTPQNPPPFESVSLELQVMDSGIGIPLEQQAQIFESFVQQQGQSALKYGGTGLGLAISQRLVELMGGQILLQSEPGQGSCFKIQLPQVSCLTAPPGYRALTSDTRPLFQPASLLIVDDLDFNRLLIKEFVKELPFKIFEAENGLQALELLKQEPIDLVLMDIKMPVLGGIETARRLRSQARFQDLPLLAMTASVMQEEEQGCLDAGFNTVIRKPIEYAFFLQTLSHFLPLKASPLKETPALNPPIQAPAAEQFGLEEFLRDLQDIKESPFIEEIQHFALKLQSQLPHSSLSIRPRLQNLVEALLLASQEFNLSEVHKLLEQVSQLLNELSQAEAPSSS